MFDVRSSTRILGSVAVVLVLSGRPASAAAGDSFPGTLGGGVSAGMGFGTPLGIFFLEGRFDPVSWFFLSAGAGLGQKNSLQLGAMAHLRLPFSSPRTEAFALTAGYGLSRGQHHWSRTAGCFLSCETYPEKRGMLWWHNLELGGEFRARGHTYLPIIIVRAAAGLAIAGNPGDLHCFGPETAWCEESFQEAGTGPYPYLGANIGFWFN